MKTAALLLLTAISCIAAEEELNNNTPPTPQLKQQPIIVVTQEEIDAAITPVPTIQEYIDQYRGKAKRIKVIAYEDNVTITYLKDGSARVRYSNGKIRIRKNRSS